MFIHENGHSHIFVDDHGQRNQLTVQPMAGKNEEFKVQYH